MRIDLSAGADPVAAIRAATGESVVAVLHPGRTPLDVAQARAAIAPLAIERAPAMRVNAVLVEPGAEPAAVDAAAAFLDAAGSTTGQWIVVAPDRP